MEIDAKVIEVSKKHLPFMAVGFESKKLTLHVGDGFEFMKNHSHEFDVIITDSSDPIGPAVNLFQENYFALMKSALKPNGIVCSQAGTFWDSMDLVKNTLRFCQNQFPVASYATTSVPTYPCGQIGFVLGSLDPNVKLNEPVTIFSNKEIADMGLKYYNSDVHKAAFCLPSFVKQEIAS